MNKKIGTFVFVGFICTLIAAGIFLQKKNAHKAVTNDQYEKPVDAIPKTPRPVDMKQSNDSLNPSSRIQPAESDPQKKTKAPLQKDAIVKKVLSALPGMISGKQPFEGLSNEEILAIVLDKTASLKARRQAAWILAKDGNEIVLKELEKILFQEGWPGSLKATIAEGLGYSSNPLAKELLITALNHEDDEVVCGAIKGLCAIGDKDAVFMIVDMMNSNDASAIVVAEAAAGLGKIDSPDAYIALIDAYKKAEELDGDFKEDIILALGNRDISETADFFKKILNNTASDPSLRLAAIEAIEDAQGDSGAFLLDYLNDPDSDIRAETAWGLALVDDPGDIAEVLQFQIAAEEEAEVRKRLYQALGNQEIIDIDTVAGFIFKEPDLDARLAGYDLLAQKMVFSETPQVSEQFKQQTIPELKEIALSKKNLNYRLSAVITLKKAGTLAALSALEDIAVKSPDDKIVKATGVNK